MKLTGFHFLAAAILIAAAGMACHRGGKKMYLAFQRLELAPDPLLETEQQYQLSLDSFRTEIYQKVQQNRHQIEAYRGEMNHGLMPPPLEKVDAIDLLDQKNDALLEELNQFQIHGSLDWILFRQELHREIGELDKAFRELGLPNH